MPVTRHLPGLLLVCCLCLPWAPPAFAETVIYYKQDQAGVYHFTNRRTTAVNGYKVYMVFRDILRHHPGLSREKIIELAKRHGKHYGIDARLVQAVIEVESGYRVNAVSSAGAEGLMQIMPGTQKDLGVLDSFDPSDNIRAGVLYLKMMLDRFGTLPLALAAYNAGPRRVEEYNGIPPFPETQEYVKKVLGRYRSMKVSP